MSFSRCYNVIIRFILLEHKPHRFYVFFGVTPIALGIEIPQVNFSLQACLDSCCRPGDLPSNEGFAAAWRFMIKKDSVASKNAVALTVIEGDPVSINLGCTVRTPRIEGSRFSLWHFHRLAIHFRTACLVKPRLQPCFADSLENPD